MRRDPLDLRAVWIASGLALALSACGGATAEGGRLEGAPDLVCRTMPTDPVVRHEVLRDLGERAHRALLAGTPEDLLVPVGSFPGLLRRSSAERYRRLRGGARRRICEAEGCAGPLRGTRFESLCGQGSRDIAPSDALGPRDRVWTLDRILVAAVDPNGRRVATWIEGRFVLTNAGIRAIDLERVERPRWEHSDLELATCEVGYRAEGLQPVVVATE